MIPKYGVSMWPVSLQKALSPNASTSCVLACDNSCVSRPG